ncbi:hypothetical protein CHLRE_14g634236v5 [Chlamydomonas reinhardtii]|uniref:Uncharacterized protein n=1 Tax=Chlamydomonas reinhardtii TaxID=3055 RepID=A0A2K3CYZ9_CHLRE|nr:uncharacterized protein CHLRE_14g634236v5 [Chlamydomonas reinhardtii]PNW73502.1 hypothetical protein CHLRE_14g634236v5 [Chlamydomonas reinhardtii]
MPSTAVSALQLDCCRTNRTALAPGNAPIASRCWYGSVPTRVPWLRSGIGAAGCCVSRQRVAGQRKAADDAVQDPAAHQRPRPSTITRNGALRRYRVSDAAPNHAQTTY